MSRRKNVEVTKTNTEKVDIKNEVVDNSLTEVTTNEAKEEAKVVDTKTEEAKVVDTKTEEAKVVDTKTEEAKADKPADETVNAVKEELKQPDVVMGKLTNEEVKALLIDENLSGEEKLMRLVKNAQLTLANVAGKLHSYNEYMCGNHNIVPKVGVGKQYDLLNLIKSVAETQDYNLFKIKFDIINTAFRELKDGAFKETFLYRYDKEWRWGKKELTTFQHMLLLLIDLSDGRVRAKNIKTINIDAALNKGDITLSDTAIANIKKYYTQH